jgi:hypothetical protein
MQNYSCVIGNTNAQKYPDIYLVVADVFVYADSVSPILVSEDAERQLIYKKIE